MTQRKPAPLSARERDCLRLIANGMGVKGVAAELGLAPSTIEKHLASVRRKLDASNTVEAVKIAMGNTPASDSCTAFQITEKHDESCSDAALRTAEAITRSTSRCDAWHHLQDHLITTGYEHSLMGVVAEPFGHITNGAQVLDSSFGDEVMELYEVAGGADADPVAMRIAVDRHPFFGDSYELVLQHMRNVPTHISKLLRRFLDMDLQRIYVATNNDPSTGAPFCLTLHINSYRMKELRAGGTPALNDIRLISQAYWTYIRSRKHLARDCGMTQRQTDALVFAARGFRIDETAEHMNVSRRTAEKLLRQARDSLRARTMSAAMFRANVYGVFLPST